jgi:hypothetical protein
VRSPLKKVQVRSAGRVGCVRSVIGVGFAGKSIDKAGYAAWLDPTGQDR